MGATLANGDLVVNPGAVRNRRYGATGLSVLDPVDAGQVRRIVSTWPGYAPTPLRALPDVAAEAGVAAVHYKDESRRFELRNFKALGGPYAVAMHLARVASEAGGRPVTPGDLMAGAGRTAVARETVCCATDGNHGRAVAWAAKLFGCRAVIFLHERVSPWRQQAIEALGADVRRTPGNYDDSVRAAAEAASAGGWTVISDTSYPGYRDIPLDVMRGYTVMSSEALEQLPPGAPPTHVFLQTGVGAMAAAVAAHLWQQAGAARPVIVLADPVAAACWFRSIEAGKPVAVTGAMDTIMAGLACGEVSEVAWEILNLAADAVIAVDDDAAKACMRRLASAATGRPPIVAGESAVAGLAALLAAAGNPDSRHRLGLTADSRIVLFGTEGASDPTIYHAIVGRTADAVVEGA